MQQLFVGMTPDIRSRCVSCQPHRLAMKLRHGEVTRAGQDIPAWAQALYQAELSRYEVQKRTQADPQASAVPEAQRRADAVRAQAEKWGTENITDPTKLETYLKGGSGWLATWPRGSTRPPGRRSPRKPRRSQRRPPPSPRSQSGNFRGAKIPQTQGA